MCKLFANSCEQEAIEEHILSVTSNQPSATSSPLCYKLCGWVLPGASLTEAQSSDQLRSRYSTYLVMPTLNPSSISHLESILLKI